MARKLYAISCLKASSNSENSNLFKSWTPMVGRGHNRGLNFAQAKFLITCILIFKYAVISCLDCGPWTIIGPYNGLKVWCRLIYLYMNNCIRSWELLCSICDVTLKLSCFNLNIRISGEKCENLFVHGQLRV